VDTTRGEWIETELNLLIERRHNQRVKTEGEKTDEECRPSSLSCPALRTTDRGEGRR
jgi:hypothetical protein